MDRLEQERREMERQEDLARLRGLRPIDDDFMRCLFRDNKPLVERVLRIITGIEDLEVITFSTQHDMKRLVGARSICLDVYATDAQGRKYDLEIQRSDQGAAARRARYHASSIDIENLDASQDYDELPESYVIFITERDVVGGGLPCYRIDRVNLDTGALFGDGAHILYVNGAWRGDTPLGLLMRDFFCSDAESMRDPLLQSATRYFKETHEGVEYMCRAFEEVRDQGIQIGLKQGMKQGMQQGMLNSIWTLQETQGITIRQAMDMLRIPADEQAKYAELAKERKLN